MLIVGLTAIVVLLLVTPRRCRAEDDDHGLLSRVDFRPQTIGSVEGVEIHSLGDLEYLSASPDFQSDLTTQDGNDAPRTKIPHRTSSEIGSNYIGTTPPRLPRSEIGDEFPWVPILMIDGNRSGGWKWGGTFDNWLPAAGDDLGEPAEGQEGGWIRFDLPKETRVTRLDVYACYEREKRFDKPTFTAPQSLPAPADFDVQVSCDATNWETVAQARALVPGSDGFAGSFEFHPVVAKQVRIALYRVPWGFAEVEIYDEAGTNVALATRGTNVMVSSTAYGAGHRRESINHRWPIHWLLGTKWMRIGYWNDASNWHRVEREKGVLHLDPVTEAAIKLAARRGVEVVLCLAYGNLLYQTDGRATPKPGEGYAVSWTTPVPTNDEGIQAFARYAGYMADKFKGVVRYYEVWNEEDAPELKSSEPEQFAALVSAASRAIKEVDPTANVVFGGTGSLNTHWTYPCLDAGIIDEVDVIAYHPYMMSNMPEDAVFLPEEAHYCDQVRVYVEGLRERGYKGELTANELAWKAYYPQHKTKDPKLPYWSHYDVSELTKAKYLARTMLIHTSLGITAFWNESWTGPGSLVRHAPNGALSPDASFYVMRTLCTAMDGLEPYNSPASAAIDVHAETGDEALEAYSFADAQGRPVVALWLRREGVDEWAGIVTDVTLRGLRADSAVAVDTLNGFEQQLQVKAGDDGVILPGMRLRDYPVLIRFDS